MTEESDAEFEKAMADATTRSRFHPEAVSAMQGKRGQMTYDAEVAWDGKHYLIGTGFKSSQAARGTALVEATKLADKMRAAGNAYVAKMSWPEAKS